MSFDEYTAIERVVLAETSGEIPLQKYTWEIRSFEGQRAISGELSCYPREFNASRLARSIIDSGEYFGYGDLKVTTGADEDIETIEVSSTSFWWIIDGLREKMKHQF